MLKWDLAIPAQNRQLEKPLYVVWLYEAGKRDVPTGLLGKAMEQTRIPCSHTGTQRALALSVLRTRQTLVVSA